MYIDGVASDLLPSIDSVTVTEFLRAVALPTALTHISNGLPSVSSSSDLIVSNNNSSTVNERTAFKTVCVSDLSAYCHYQ